MTTTKKKIKCAPSTRPNWQIEKQQEHTDRDRYSRETEKEYAHKLEVCIFLNELHFMQLIAATKIAFEIGMHLHFCNRVLMLLEIKLCKICYNSTTEFVGWFSFPLSRTIFIYLACHSFQFGQCYTVFNWKYSIFL